ncbi:probable superoxide dismutase [Cu-Zn] [Serendipita indica DSM 11827]|uniref:Superoxide dismutase [Cu-Zn] n=1 Tax=Serendipita indica (strain DSM 11827) TaxID=1109443 RepID=G4T8J8_SERID|nr:probable superoxide dismutase [Cu-Zn] [Serendipita indica DSM 11827]
MHARSTISYFVKLLVCLTFVTYAAAHNTPVKAVAVLTGTSGVSGTVYFQQDKPHSKVKITGTIQGLTANAKRGFHVHTFGDLSGGCNSTGTHFNPFNQTHGGPNDPVRHVGDLGNVQTDNNGTATLNFEDWFISLRGHLSVVGRGLVVHAGTDDFGKGGQSDSLTTGHAGARLACGIIGKHKIFYSAHKLTPAQILYTARTL